MQIYWTLKSIPELSGLPSEEIWRVWRAAYWKTTRHWQFWVSLVGLAYAYTSESTSTIVLAVTSVGSLVPSYFRKYKYIWRVHIFVRFSHLSTLPDGDLSQ